MRGNTSLPWGTYPIPNRARLKEGNCEMGEPANLISPLLTGNKPIRLFISVDLPTPLRPMTARISPCFMSRSMPCNTGFEPYPVCRFWVCKSKELDIRFSQINFNDSLIIFDVSNSAAGKDFAVIQYGDLVSDSPSMRRSVCQGQYGYAFFIQV